MNLDWSFSVWTALGGGMLIGLAAAILLLFNGRIAGISGILGSVLRPVKGDVAWRLAFLLGLIGAPLVYAMPAAHVEAGSGTLIAAGLLVGLGTRFGSGCTSGHGVCGVSRMAPRSLAATALFMLAGFVTVYLVRHL
jgi:uncharacterized membrane protein YedE/YeeE